MTNKTPSMDMSKGESCASYSSRVALRQLLLLRALPHRTSRSTRPREQTPSALSKGQREALLRHASQLSGDPYLDSMNRAVVLGLLERSC